VHPIYDSFLLKPEERNQGSIAQADDCNKVECGLALPLNSGWEGSDQKMSVFSSKVKTIISISLLPAFQGPEEELPWIERGAYKPSL